MPVKYGTRDRINFFEFSHFEFRVPYLQTCTWSVEFHLIMGVFVVVELSDFLNGNCSKGYFVC